MTIRRRFTPAVMLLAAACGQPRSQTTQSSAQSQSAPTQAQQPGTLQGVKYRIPVYSSNVTGPAAPGLEPGIYQLQTSDSVLTVLAWYKSHIPGDMGGTWVTSDPSSPADITDWSYSHAHTATGDFSVDIEHARNGVPGYAPGTKTIVEVIDR